MDGLNRYAYCRNNPIKYVDPSGHGVEKASPRINSAADAQAYYSNPTGYNNPTTYNQTSLTGNEGQKPQPNEPPPPAPTPNAPETNNSSVQRLPPTDGNDTKKKFNWKDGGWHCDEDAYNNALDDGKDPGWVDPSNSYVDKTWEKYKKYEVKKEKIPANESGYRFADFKDSDHHPGHLEYWKTDANGKMTVKKGSGQEETTWVNAGSKVGPIHDWLSPTYHYIILSDNK